MPVLESGCMRGERERGAEGIAVRCVSVHFPDVAVGRQPLVAEGGGGRGRQPTTKIGTHGGISFPSRFPSLIIHVVP